MTWRIEIPWTIPSQNVYDRQHWSAKHRQTNTVQRMIAWRSREAGIPPATGPRRVTITSIRPRLIRDRANLVGGAKGLVDAIVRDGLLVDDDDQSVMIEYRQETLQGRRPVTVIEIEDHSTERSE